MFSFLCIYRSFFFVCYRIYFFSVQGDFINFEVLINIYKFFHNLQGDRGLPGPPGPAGPAGIGLIGPKVNPSSTEQCYACNTVKNCLWNGWNPFCFLQWYSFPFNAGFSWPNRTTGSTGFTWRGHSRTKGNAVTCPLNSLVSQMKNWTGWCRWSILTSFLYMIVKQGFR